MIMATEAEALYDKSIALLEADDYTAALAASEAALGRYRELSAAEADRYLPKLLEVLQNHAEIHVRLHQTEAYLSTTAEAIAVCRVLAASLPDDFRAELATILNNVSLTLIEHHPPAEAMACIREAVAISRDLLAQRPTDDEARWYLALELSNLSRILARVGDRDGALDAAQEYASLTRDLAGRTAEQFTNALALSLTMLSRRLSQVGQFDAALASVEESLAIHRELAAPEPYLRSSTLADALDQSSIVLLALQRESEALGPSEEAVDIYTELHTSLGMLEAELIEALRQLARVLDALGRPAEAETARAKASTLAAAGAE
jgi:tetratricopeptide (TPR) repeat protein